MEKLPPSLRQNILHTQVIRHFVALSHLKGFGAIGINFPTHQRFINETHPGIEPISVGNSIRIGTSPHLKGLAAFSTQSFTQVEYMQDI